MKFGLHLIPQDISIDELIRAWQWADTAGFDWIDISDHFYEAPAIHGGDGPCFEATTGMAALACLTKNVRVGVVVLGMNYRHPAVLANALATIDHLSGGRMEAGLGAGWHEAEYRAYGIPFLPIKERLDILEEGMQVVKLLLTKDRADFSGKHFTLTNAACNPKPVQANPRIWIGGNGEKRTLRMVARHADGWNSPYTSPEEFTRLSKLLDEYCEGEGRDPASIERNVNLSFHLAASEADRARSEAHFSESWGAAAPAFRSRGVVLGTPSEARELVARYAETGCARVNISVRPPLDWDSLHAWAAEVIPAFRSAAPV